MDLTNMKRIASCTTEGCVNEGETAVLVPRSTSLFTYEWPDARCGGCHVELTITQEVTA